MLHFLCAGHLDLNFEYPAAGHKVTPLQNTSEKQPLEVFCEKEPFKLQQILAT